MQGTQSVKPYKTVRAASEIELVIQRSRFIGRCFPVSDEAQAAETLESIRKRHWDASHNCYAMRIGFGGMLTRSSDDGEPSGTAGAPILGALTRMELTDALCVVTRYFGGVLLGSGGLIRAYSGAASEAARQAGVVLMQPCVCLVVQLAYAQFSAMEALFRDCGEVEGIAYTDVVTARLWVREDEAAAVAARLTDASGGRAAIGEDGRAMRPVDCNNF